MDTKQTHMELLAEKYSVDIDYLSRSLSDAFEDDGNFSNSSDSYFWERILDITQQQSREVWVSRWELKGLLSRLEENDVKYRGPESHIGGVCAPSIQHFNIMGRDIYGSRFKKHLFITEDPNDPRLSRLMSYDPNHPSE